MIAPLAILILMLMVFRLLDQRDALRREVADLKEALRRHCASSYYR